MKETIQRKLNDSALARWSALILIASMMFFAYMFVDVMSPLKSLVESARGWDSGTFGTYAASEYFLNVFVFFLIFAGIILDKMGIRFTGLLSASLMVVGASIKFVGITDWFQTTGLCAWLDSWWVAFPGSAKMASLGFMIFGCGAEMAGTTVSKAIAKWFDGKEMALAMGLEMAIARLGVFAVMWIAPMISNAFDKSIVAPVGFCTALLLIGLICYTVFVYMDKALDRQLIAAGELKEEKSSDEEFQIKDLGMIFSSKMFWLVALLCVLYYSAIFPFQKYAVNMLQCNLTLDEPTSGFWASDGVVVLQYVIMVLVAAAAFASNFSKNSTLKYSALAVAILGLVAYCWMGFMRQSASAIFAVFPLLAVGITPILGKYVDYKGKAASMLLLGSLLLIACHLTFAFILPMFKGSAVGGVVVAYLTILVLGASFSLVPASLWPSVPKLVDSKIIGSAYALIFWIQNIGLWLFPMLIGIVLDNTNPDITAQLEAGTMTEAQASVAYDYTWPLVMLACLGIAALLLSFVLKVIDRKKHYGLEEPNIQPEALKEEIETDKAEIEGDII